MFLLLNKIDRMPKSALLPLIESCSKELPFTEMIPISRSPGTASDLALERLIAHLPEAQPIFPRISSPTSRSVFWPRKSFVKKR